ncbi:arylformamidase [Altererythrobacter lutimaris]|uniref:Kynurenine formamidase n=1 Tax=Altererythrobacter lutimaris TaxID=2743979 RepID=A0A850H9P5_9SPHN|nr:arylformamidase [Altererythrobacter lutimaris]NVE96054.1 arylformamidase [Altererythrobacter lutimaris]
MFRATPRIWDISQRIGTSTPLWPGEPPVRLSRRAEISSDCPVNVGALTLGLHTGTHADAPLHYSNAGAASADTQLAPYIGPCVVADVRGCHARVEIGDCDWDTLAGAQRVLFRTYERFPYGHWDENFAAIAPEVVARLREGGALLIGTDTPSLDPQNSKTMDTHKEVLRGDMRILEGLVLDDISAGEYELISLPLAIEGGDASPVRAVLRELL